jgi:hypothetical protein
VTPVNIDEGAPLKVLALSVLGSSFLGRSIVRVPSVAVPRCRLLLHLVVIVSCLSFVIVVVVEQLEQFR